MNFTKIEVLAPLARNSGRVLRRAMATTCSEGASPGRTVRIHEPKDCHTSVGLVAVRMEYHDEADEDADGAPQQVGDPELQDHTLLAIDGAGRLLEPVGLLQQ